MMNTESTSAFDQSLLANFEGHSLDALNNSRLMQRMDSKFIFHISAFNTILQAINGAYSILEIDKTRLFHYQSTYFDTDKLSFYYAHHNGKLNRYKVRHRLYADTQTAYIEIKFKTNKGITIKQRLASVLEPLPALTESYGFLKDHGIAQYKNLHAEQQTQFHRVMLANEQNSERISFDIRPHFINPNTAYKKTLDDWVIAELKQPKLNRQSAFFKVMRQLHIPPISFSKYCMGMCLVSDKNIKTNRFSKASRNITKLVKRIEDNFNE